jgi:superfamily II DNA/RNA helicase
LKFSELHLDAALLEGIASIGFEETTPVQEQAIPVIMQGKDMIASAQTGTGKTAAFLLPVIDRIISTPETESVKALVIVPTRELAMQIDQHMQGLSYFTPVSSMAVYGGTDGISFDLEKKSLSEGADVVICTPGRMIAHLNQGYVKLDGLQFLVLDEADRMLDMGFFDDIMKIVSYLPKERQTLMFSATMPDKIRLLARKILQDPVEINIAVSRPADKVLQVAYVTYENQKIPLALSLLKGNRLRSVLIFCSTKSSTKSLSRELKRTGLRVEEIHSDLEQQDRERVLLEFRNHSLNILVATDILSRGIDIEDIDLVLNFDVPNDGEDYIHRIGRTARAASEGMAITFISEKEQRKFMDIESLLGASVFKSPLPDDLGPGPEYKPGAHRNDSRRPFNKDTRKKNFKKRG